MLPGHSQGGGGGGEGGPARSGRVRCGPPRTILGAGLPRYGDAAAACPTYRRTCAADAQAGEHPAQDSSFLSGPSVGSSFRRSGREHSPAAGRSSTHERGAIWGAPLVRFPARAIPGTFRTLRWSLRPMARPRPRMHRGPCAATTPWSRSGPRRTTSARRDAGHRRPVRLSGPVAQGPATRSPRTRHPPDALPTASSMAHSGQQTLPGPARFPLRAACAAPGRPTRRTSRRTRPPGRR
jgi:hypothetical protein